MLKGPAGGLKTACFQEVSLWIDISLSFNILVISLSRSVHTKPSLNVAFPTSDSPVFKFWSESSGSGDFRGQTVELLLRRCTWGGQALTWTSFKEGKFDNALVLFLHARDITPLSVWLTTLSLTCHMSLKGLSVTLSYPHLPCRHNPA